MKKETKGNSGQPQLLDNKGVIDYLAKHELSYEVESPTQIEGLPIPENHLHEISIDWGDWKHDHGYCDYLMQQAGYTCIAEQVTEEDGSDTYSAIHRYVFIDWWNKMSQLFKTK